ncbi:MAG: hypothetical protein WEB88_11200 [Gemmatimonadota bacterium]
MDRPRLPRRAHAHAALATTALTVLLACPAHLAAQSAAGSRWAVDAVVARTVQSDELASPLRYRGLGPGVALGYERVGPTSRSGLQLLYMRPSLTSDISRGATFVEAGHRLRISVPHLRKVRERQRLTLLLGGQLAGDAYYRRHDYAPFSEHYLDAFLLLQVMTAVEWRPGPDLRIEQRLAVPLAGVAWRGAYTGLKYGPSARFELPHRLQGLTHSVGVSRAVGSGVALRAAHEVGMLRHPDPWRLAVLTQRLSVGLEWRRGGAAMGPGVTEAGR